MIKVSFIIPTLNAETVLDTCLKSIAIQNFDSKLYEIIIVDGGSNDKTIEIAKKYNCVILENPLKTAEAGKAVGVKKAKGEYIALIDSDNILPNKNWLKLSLFPLDNDKNIIGSEPISFTYRKKSGFMERYSALIGANDPYAFVTGVYDRKNYINNKWTGLKIKYVEYSEYLKITLNPNQQISTIGANGTIFRTDFLKKHLKSDYLFDIDIISQVLNESQKPIYFAKTKTSIIHTFCESSLVKFVKKQKRRLVDYYYYKSKRTYNWEKTNNLGQLKFILYSLFIIPAFLDSIRGFIKKPDFVWFIHPIICLITLYLYTTITLKYKFGILKPQDRSKWRQ